MALRPPIYVIFVLILGYLTFNYYSTNSSQLNNTPLSSSTTTSSIVSSPPSKSFTQRIIGLGDLHGDLAHCSKVLRIAGLINEENNWIGGNTILVQTGDIVDRGRDTIALYKLMDELRSQAPIMGGGAVYSLLGNHEIMNAIGDYRYVTQEDVDTFGGLEERKYVMKQGWIGESWRKNYSITARIPYSLQFPFLPPSLVPSPPVQLQEEAKFQHFFGDFIPPSAPVDPFSHVGASFVHGGITPLYLNTLKNQKNPISEINSIGRSIMLKVLNSSGSSHGLPSSCTPEEQFFWSREGPMWDRTYALDENEEEVCALAAKACDLLKVRRLIMGHTPHFEGIVSRCEGRILLIDTGISRAYGGALSALEIIYTLTPQSEVDPSTTTENSFFEQEIVSALYETRKVELNRKERFIELPNE